MMVVPCYLAPSSIQGLGLFAAENIAEGQLVYRYLDDFDRLFAIHNLDRFPEQARNHIIHLGEFNENHPDHIMLGGDNSSFINHSRTPNLRENADGKESYAACVIRKDEEFTIDYRDMSRSYYTQFGWV